MPRRTRPAPGPEARYLTTHQVAGLLHVSQPTVVNWVEAGHLHAHRTPGGHRRIAREELFRFARAHDYPLPSALGQPEKRVPKVLVVDAEPDLAELVRDALTMDGAMDVRVASGVFEAGFLAGSFEPDLVLVDLDLPGIEALETAAVLRARGRAGVRLLGWTAFRSTAVAARLKGVGVHAVLEKPVEVDKVLALVKAAVGVVSVAATED